MHNIGGENKFSAQADGDPAKIVDVLRGVEGVTDVAYDNGSFILTADEGADIRKNVFYAAAEADLPLLSFAPVDVSLEAVFARLTKKGEEK